MLELLYGKAGVWNWRELLMESFGPPLLTAVTRSYRKYSSFLCQQSLMERSRGVCLVFCIVVKPNQQHSYSTV